MGYTTQFKGELKFTNELSAKQINTLDKMFKEDSRNHPEWEVKDLYYIDLEFNDDYTGIRWDGSEKTYGMTEIVNLIITQMRKQWPDSGLSGTMVAQGEELEDRWTLTIGDDGFAYKTMVAITRKLITCPHSERSADEGLRR